MQTEYAGTAAFGMGLDRSVHIAGVLWADDSLFRVIETMQGTTFGNIVSDMGWLITW